MILQLLGLSGVKHGDKHRAAVHALTWPLQPLTWGLGSSRSSPLKPIFFLYATAPFRKLARLSSSSLDAALGYSW